jgi:hypothetical protein
MLEPHGGDEYVKRAHDPSNTSETSGALIICRRNIF